ncbi:MAG: Asp-tRNA(Asn)/Glu-tRNA(Gln) amidotransferase subunit GatC [Candidatus Saccharicenans sp.]|nr:MAG: Asp-tRNA(Asn)/Glu-tRNA(Gln) amidotransferase GatCAB subunit C [Candidatus Aminicenantes bacterium]HEK84880.1 Asp-tRNA(Asn)/Glu-tRNA(Gln) amidotransferase subunit GatC [Candidatus Aminicenantes bacterium]
MKIDLEHLSRLANLELTEEEKKHLPAQMEKIIDWVGELSKLSLEEEGKYTPVDFCLRLEADEVQDSLPQEEVLALAPEKAGDFIKVPKVLQGK